MGVMKRCALACIALCLGEGRRKGWKGGVEGYRTEGWVDRWTGRGGGRGSIRVREVEGEGVATCVNKNGPTHPLFQVLGL